MLIFTYPFLLEIIKAQSFNGTIYVARAPDIGLTLALQGPDLNIILSQMEEALYWFILEKLKNKQEIPIHDPHKGNELIKLLQKQNNTLYFPITTKIYLDNNRPDLASIKRQLDNYRLDHFGYLASPVYNIKIGTPLHKKH